MDSNINYCFASIAVNDKYVDLLVNLIKDIREYSNVPFLFLLIMKNHLLQYLMFILNYIKKKYFHITIKEKYYNTH